MSMLVENGKEEEEEQEECGEEHVEVVAIVRESVDQTRAWFWQREAASW